MNKNNMNKYSVARSDSQEIEVTVYCETPTQAVQTLLEIAKAGRQVLACKEVLFSVQDKWIVATQNGWSYVVTYQPQS